MHAGSADRGYETGARNPDGAETLRYLHRIHPAQCSGDRFPRSTLPKNSGEQVDEQSPSCHARATTRRGELCATRLKGRQR